MNNKSAIDSKISAQGNSVAHERLLVPEFLRQIMFAQAAASPNREICGLLFGHKGSDYIGQEYIGIPNIATVPNRFVMDPEALISALFAKKGSEHAAHLIGIVHSHPDVQGKSVPSLIDVLGHWSKDTLSIILYRIADTWEMAAYRIDATQLTTQRISVAIVSTGPCG
ncbi:Mov34/MPN/PAD-1 family protein [Fodinisporobacter ferrooxydans]|uniref:Mov34/MPN/PAD-1 family protein n=1 Tax=Fodinisporobacter ferrooxydans TaxID=2901836 RepID=A0ABY4CIF3_9BACL|nr:Mov34/MPN/PAD-1 family protein [Alicyclobacillaceae bacterium MYW30-H2]